MLKRLRTAHPILYCILSEVLFLGSMVVFSLLATIVLAAAGADFDTMDGYLFGSVQEAVGLAVALLLLTRTGRLDLLRRRGCGFLNGLLVGMYPLFFIGYTFFGTLAFGRPDTPLLPLPRILTFLLNMILVGVAEELVFRGIIAQTLLERYGILNDTAEQAEALRPEAIAAKTATPYGGVRALVRRDLAPAGFQLEKPTIEDIILALVKGEKQ